jgi:hypothetical protein
MNCQKEKQWIKFCADEKIKLKTKRWYEAKILSEIFE